MDRRVSLDLLDNATYDEVAQRRIDQDIAEEDDLLVPPCSGPLVSTEDTLPDIDFEALAHDFYSGSKNVVCLEECMRYYTIHLTWGSKAQATRHRAPNRYLQATHNSASCLQTSCTTLASALKIPCSSFLGT